MSSNNDILLKVPLRIEVVSPVHIGMGDRLSNKSFARQGDKVYVINEEKFITVATRTPQLEAQFEQFCLTPLSLTKFLQNNNIKIGDIAEYAVKITGTDISNFYFPFIKLPQTTPLPYLPGSSLKGALRSAFLKASLLRNEKLKLKGEDKVKQQSDRKKSKNADDTLETLFFGKDQHHEWVRLLQIADTEPVGIDHLGVADIRIYSSTQERRLREKSNYEKAMILSPEVLTPKTQLRSNLTINQYLSYEQAESELNFNKYMSRVAGFAAVCDRVAEEQISQEIRFFEYHGQRDLVDWYKDLDECRKKLSSDRFECLLRLGWGTGFDNKTVSDVFSDETFNEIRDAYELPVGRPGRRGDGLTKSLSPKSRKLAVVKTPQGHTELQPLGWVILRAQ